MADCCDECTDNVEICCDDSDIKDTLFISGTDDKYDINMLIECLCCQNRYHTIYDVVRSLSIEEAKILFTQLRNSTKSGYLSLELETRFSDYIRGRVI